MKALEALVQRNWKLTAVLFVLLISLLIIYGYIFSKAQILNQPSTAIISLNSNMLNVHFNITNQDLPQSQVILAELGGQKFDDINMEIDPGSAKKIQQSLPVTVNLHFGPNFIQFEGTENNILVSSLPRTEVRKQDYSIATGSASFDFKNSDQLELVTHDPGVVLDYATASGELQISPKLSPMLKVLGKVDTIEIHTVNNKISGKILLK